MAGSSSGGRTAQRTASCNRSNRQLASHIVAGGELLVVEAGIFDLSITGAAAWVRRRANGRGKSERETTLTPTDGAYTPAGTIAALRNAGDDPHVLFLVAIIPADS